MTVAHEIKNPFLKPRRTGKWAYWPPLVTIWHVDPQKRKGTCCTKDDDSCGWFSPPHTTEEHAAIEKLGRDQWGTIFERQRATNDGESYAYLCYEPSSYDAIYWAWRAIKHAEAKHDGWQYGCKLSAAELALIYSLDSNPVDNLRFSVAQVKDAESCGEFFLTVYRCYRRFNRPWWRHPKWHVRHWSLQVHPVENFKRWAFTRCAGCGGRFRWGASGVGSWHGTGPLWFKSENLRHMNCAVHPPFKQALAVSGEPLNHAKEKV